jgi:CheY-like chemotaxis protein
VEPTQPKPVILVVDDDAFMRRFYKASLERHGARVEQAANGTQALQRLTEVAVDLVVMDQMMLDKDGLQVAREMRQNPSTAHIPVIMVTSNRSEEHQERARRQGVDGFITKPLSLDRLLSRIHELLHKNRGATDGERAPRSLIRRGAEVVSLEDVTTQVLNLMRLSGKLNGVEVRLDIRQDSLVHIHRSDLEQVVLNMLVHASESLDARGGHLCLTVETAGSVAVLAVHDNGGGTDEELVPHVFEPHVTRLGEVRRLVEAAGGKVSLHSLPGEGTLVATVLPVLVANRQTCGEFRAEVA